MSKALGTRQIERIEGLNYARAWREKNRTKFDALYAARSLKRCSQCGKSR